MRNTFLFLWFSLTVFAQKNEPLTYFEKGNGNQSTTYEECIAFYEQLATQFSTVKIIEQGITDCGKPLHLVVFDAEKQFDFKTNKVKILINNGIHPGEPDGIDASMQFIRDLATKKIKPPKNTLIAVIPVYNIDGMLNRNTSSRANQNGPEEYGFRGNGRNYDLNRDFIKCDTKNAQSFQKLFHFYNPDVFLDNHVSNGADYQYTFTCIATQHERLGPTLGNYFNKQFYPAVCEKMNDKKIDVSPYVNVHYGTPDKGFEQFADSPRYATGYTTLFNTLGFVPETHMLKSFSQRVKVTYEFMESVLAQTEIDFAQIKQQRQQNLKNYAIGTTYPLQWELDSTQVEYINFKGFEGKYKTSAITGKDRLYYDRNQPFTKKIPYYPNYKGTNTITIPEAYFIPQTQWHVIEALQRNNIQLTTFKSDTTVTVQRYKIIEYQTNKTPYEGHYGHYQTKVKSEMIPVTFRKGDYKVATQQEGVKFILETLEPEAVDSFFNWNFFDSILQQKEYFSSYVFEDLAFEFLAQNPQIKAQFEAKKQTDTNFAQNPQAQLDWIYRNSPYYEKTHLVYPIYRKN